MPLLKPEILAAISAATPEGTSEDSELMSERGLSFENDLDNLTFLATNAVSETVRLSATQTSLKLKNKLKETAPVAPSITIIIQDPNAPAGINPILLPRELHAKLRNLETTN